MIEFNSEAKKEADWIISRYPQKESAILPLLRLLERKFGEVSEEGIKYIASLLDIPPAKVYGTSTFYTHYRQPDMGKYVIQVCSTLPCALGNSETIFDYISKRLGIKNGETTQDKSFTLKKVECLANCDKAPCIQINSDDYGNITIGKIDKILDELSNSERKR